MIISILLLIVLISVLIIYNIYSKTSVMFIIQLGGLCTIIVSLILYMMKISYYNGIFYLEMWIYQMMRPIQINITDIKLLMTIGYMFIFISQMFIMWEFSKKNTAAKYVEVISFIIAMGFFVINVPVISEIIYIKSVQMFTYSGSELVNSILAFVNYAVIFYFMLLPFGSIISSIKSTGIILKKRRSVIIIAFLVFIDIIILLFSFFTKLRNMLKVFMMSMLGTGYTWSGELQGIFLIIGIFALIVMAVVIIKYDVFNTIDFFKPYVASSNMKVLLMDMKYIFHDFKNIMMTIIALQNSVLDNYGNEEGKKALYKIGDFAYSYAEKVGDLLDIYKSKRIDFKEVDLFKCVKDAVSRIEDESGIRINITNTYENTVILGDEYQLKILFYNLLKNATDAVNSKNIPDGRIDISFIKEDKWICIDLTDNGVGMSQKECKRIWRPFVSSKNTFMNWGIGLSQVRNIVEAHLGYIDILSKKNEYTKIQLVFQRNKVGR